MDFIRFYKELKGFPAFSLQDINNLSEKVYHHRLVEWQKKGYIKRAANGVYFFTDARLDENYLYFIANKMYSPSYISLETALSHYGFIPEGVFSITSVSTKKTYETGLDGIPFTYRTINERIFFGYTMQPWRDTVIKFAEPEKTLIDYFYLNPSLHTFDAVEEMRFNPDEICEKINQEKLDRYLAFIQNKSLIQRISILKLWIKENV